MTISLSTKLVPIPSIPKTTEALLVSPLGLLAQLVGTWKGGGFNQIFRPFSGQGSDNFLELNLTTETLEFTEIPGEIPNRGMKQADISLFGMTYLQQIADANVKATDGTPAGIHIEPGIWINIPSTTNPAEPATVARLANIPHGTSLVAQGTAQTFPSAPHFDPVDITPFLINQPGSKIPFPQETTLSSSTPFRSPPNDIIGVTQTMIDNPNSVLDDALVGKTITSTTVIQISTLAPAPPASPGAPNAPNAPNAGGGTSNIAFLVGLPGTPPDINANAHAVLMDATFWISPFVDGGGVHGTLLQYSQRVILNFNGLSWPHVSVANLIKQGKNKPEIKEVKEFKEKEKFEIKEHKPEIKEIETVPQPISIPDPALRAGPTAVGRPFITPEERPTVGAQTLKDKPKSNP